LIAIGSLLLLRRRASWIEASGLAPLSPSWVFPYLMRTRRYRTVFVSSVLLYGVFYSFITSVLVYQPGVDFGAAYAAMIPSVSVTPVAASPLYSPVLTAYLTDHFAILLIPLTVLLALATSVLVGVNLVLSSFAFDSRARAPGRGWLGGIGAFVGLFTGCPTCAGLFFANILGGTGAVSFATILGYYQPVFILLSLPVLVATPYLISRSLSKVFKEGCIVIRPSGPDVSSGAKR
ncbi:MAG TPA: hypothetical protein VFE91_07890, partial [Nitrososphaerales archaeon]|nr:hypothetical protein [Nitrososphaerales archaeon]